MSIEPKIEKNEKKNDKENIKEPIEQPPAVTPEAAKYWDYVQRTRLLEVAKIAVFNGEGGLIIVPLDRLGRVLLDSTLFLPIETLDVLATSMSKLAEGEK
jgi:hypothetical protein